MVTAGFHGLPTLPAMRNNNSVVLGQRVRRSTLMLAKQFRREMTPGFTPSSLTSIAMVLAEWSRLMMGFTRTRPLATGWEKMC
jgi:hypothetical protein